MKLYTFVLILLGLCSFLCKCEWKCQGNPSNEAKLASLLYRISKNCDSPSSEGALHRETELDKGLFEFMYQLFRAKRYFFNATTGEMDHFIGPFFLGLLASNHTLSFVPPFYGFKYITRWLNFTATPSLNRIIPPFFGSPRDFQFHQDFCTSSYSPLFTELADSILQEPIARNKAILYAHSSFPMIRYFDASFYEWYNVFLPMISKIRLSRLWEVFQPFESIEVDNELLLRFRREEAPPCANVISLFHESINLLFPTFDHSKEGGNLPVCNYTTEMFDISIFAEFLRLDTESLKFSKDPRAEKGKSKNSSLTDANLREEKLGWFGEKYAYYLRMMDEYKGLLPEELKQTFYWGLNILFRTS